MSKTLKLTEKNKKKLNYKKIIHDDKVSKVSIIGAGMVANPGVVYKIYLNKGEILDLQNPTNLPDPTLIKYIEEPWIKATIITPDQYLGPIIKLCQNKRGVQTNLNYSGNRAILNYEIPLNEIVFDFNDRLKSMTSGFASFEYEIIGH